LRSNTAFPRANASSASEAADADLGGAAAGIAGDEIAPIAGSIPIVHIREGRPRDELLKLIAEEPTISILVLAAGTGPEGPGPLITALTGKAAARLRIPITIVPGGLSLDQLDALS
jgi:hypothetical protein